MAETFQAWQCIGCGKIDGPAQCVGVCQDRPVELVNAADFRAAQAAARRERDRAGALEAVVRRIALTYPKPGEVEATWKALQATARRALDRLPGAADRTRE
mgnify:CR=1 FL=1